MEWEPTCASHEQAQAQPTFSSLQFDEMALNVATIGCILWLYIHSLGATSDAQGPGSGCLHVNTSTHRIVDTEGRERYFHGVNVVVKGPPWLPELETFDPLTSFVQKDMQTLQDLGLNAIRYYHSASDVTEMIYLYLQIWYDVAWSWTTKSRL